MTSALLYGIHDRQGAHIVPPGGWVVDTIALSENPQPTDYTALRADVNWIVRLNWGYGLTGTIPLPHQHDLMAQAAVAYVAGSKGADRFIVGNEPNHEQERPNGIYITSEHYAECFLRVRDAIKHVKPSTQVIPAPCAPYHANPVNWLDYWREMLNIIVQKGGCDGIAVHAYTRTSNLDDLTSGATMGPPLDGQHSGFYTFIDALTRVPESLRHLPAYITEFNELLPDGWHNANTGIVQRAYELVHKWNRQNGEQQIHCLVLYRWPRFDRWHIEGKQGVIDDFQQAVGRGYSSPNPGVTDQMQTFIPAIHHDTQAAPNPPDNSPLPPREWDSRLTARGVSVETPSVAPGQLFWRATKARWFSEAEAGGRHHIYVEAPAGVPFLVRWPSGHAGGQANGRGGFDAGNFPMSASLDEFSVQMDDGKPSETVRGIGMGADGNAGIHTSTLVTFELVTMPQAQQPPAQAQQPAHVPVLVHPVTDPRYRNVTQGWGERPDYYRRFTVDGVALKGHNGLDFGTPIGTMIAAVDAGRVVEVADDTDGYGLYVKLSHSWGESLYAHLRDQLVQVGEWANKGQYVGKSGNTGNSTGPHLHYGMRVAPFNRRDGWGGFTNPQPHLINAGAPLPITTREQLLALIKAAAQEFGVEWQLLASLAWAESSWNPQAVSAASAQGLTQIMPATWAEWGPRVGASDPFNPRDNLRVGAAYLAWLQRQMGGNAYKALHAYVWGIGNVLSGVTPPDEVIAYGAKIVHGRDLLKAVGA